MWYNALHTCISCHVCNYITLTLISTSCTIKCMCKTQHVYAVICKYIPTLPLKGKEALSLELGIYAWHTAWQRKRGLSIRRACSSKTNMYTHKYSINLRVRRSGIRSSNFLFHRHLGSQIVTPQPNQRQGVRLGPASLVNTTQHRNMSLHRIHHSP